MSTHKWVNNLYEDWQYIVADDTALEDYFIWTNVAYEVNRIRDQRGKLRMITLEEVKEAIPGYPWTLNGILEPMTKFIEED